MRIGLDIMGGDHFPHAPIGGVVSVAPALPPSAELILLGDQPMIEQGLKQHNFAFDRYKIVHAPSIITMEDKPAQAIVQKPDSSIAVGLQMLKSHELDCFISAGNTGAVMAGSVIVLGCIEGILRPTVGSFFPNKNGRALVCDVGANIEAKAEHMVQFGILGAVFMQCTQQMQNPRIGLLNVGEEKKKGTALLQHTYELLEKTKAIPLCRQYARLGLKRGSADVFVCDGLVGNILLKYGESFYPLLKPRLPNDPFIEGYNFEIVGGLPFLGVKGNVIIGHGISGAKAFHNMILRAVEAIEANLLQNIQNAIAKL